MYTYYQAACTDLGTPYKNHNKIVNAFNRSTQILDFYAPQHGIFLIQASQNTSTSDINEIIRNTHNADILVTHLNPINYSFWLPKDETTPTSKWLKRHARIYEQQETEKHRTTKLKNDFDTHSVKLPDGTEIVIAQNGSVTIQEPNEEQPRKVRLEPSPARQNIIK